MVSKVFWKRIIALSIDMIIASFLSFAISITVIWYGINTEIGYEFLTLSDDWIVFRLTAEFILYFLISESLFSKTLGKRIVGLLVVSSSYEKPNIWQCFVRNIFRTVDQFLLIGSALIFFDKKHRRLGDFVSKTMVIEKEELDKIGEMCIK